MCILVNFFQRSFNKPTLVCLLAYDLALYWMIADYLKHFLRARQWHFDGHHGLDGGRVTMREWGSLELLFHTDREAWVIDCYLVVLQFLLRIKGRTSDSRTVS